MSIKSAWNKYIKPIVMNPIPYISLWTFFNTTNAQSKPDHKPLTEIVREGDIVKIPENKMGEFMKNEYVPKKNLSKPDGEITLDGYVTDAFTTEPISDVSTTLYLYDWPTPLDTLQTTTDFQGHYSFIITGMNDQKQITNIGMIEYFGGQAKITLNNNKKVKITKWDIIGQEFKNEQMTEQEMQSGSIDLKLIDNQPIVTRIEIDGKAYDNIHIKQGDKYYVRAGKSIEQITEENYKQLNKIQTLAGFVDFRPDNQHHRYYYVVGGEGWISGDTHFDMSLLPRMNLEQPIVDPDYQVIDTIKTLRDLWWYGIRIQGEWDNKEQTNRLWPIKLFVNPTNAPNGWASEVRNVIQYYRDSLDINPDSLITENPIYAEPEYNNGYSAINMVYTDSLGVPQKQNSTIEFWLSASHETFVGGYIYIDTNKVNNTIDAGKYVAFQIQRYIVPILYQTKHEDYLSYTTNTFIGPRNRPNNDEKKWITTGRYSKPFFINRAFP